MPMLKTRSGTRFEGFVTENSDSQRHFLTLEKPWGNLEDRGGLNREVRVGACAVRLGNREDHLHSIALTIKTAKIFPLDIIFLRIE